MTLHHATRQITNGRRLAWRSHALRALAAVVLAVALLWAPNQVGADANYSMAVKSASTSAATAVGDPIIMAAGDIACDPDDGAFYSGNGTKTRCQQMWTAAELTSVTAVLPLGDTQYNCGTLASYQSSYNPSWGQQKAISHPAVGNHEYGTGCSGSIAGAAGYFTYFGAASTPLQPSCTVKCQGYYSYNLGAWHLIALNSECSKVGGCSAGSAQEKWLTADLAANHAACTLVYWHRPYFSSGQTTGDTQMHDIWVDLYNARVDVVLNGHDHNYQHYAPQDPNGNAAKNGITEFVVGTGGESHGSFAGIAANSVALDATTYGVLQLTLHAASYDWQFIPDGKSGSFKDAGSASCV